MDQPAFNRPRYRVVEPYSSRWLSRYSFHSSCLVTPLRLSSVWTWTQSDAGRPPPLPSSGNNNAVSAASSFNSGGKGHMVSFAAWARYRYRLTVAWPAPSTRAIPRAQYFQHPRFARVHGLFEIPGGLCVAMENIEGLTLNTLLRVA